MTPAVYSEWNKIKKVQISDDGNWAMYQITKEVGDKTLKIYNTREDKTYTFYRAQNASFDQGGRYAFFIIEHPYEEVRKLERLKTKKDKMPKDTLCIYDLEDKVLTKIPQVKSYKSPKEWGGYIAFLHDPDKVIDTIRTPKKESKENGSKLILRNLITSQSDTLFYAKDYLFAKKEKGLVATSRGAEGVLKQGVYVYDFDLSEWKPILESKGDAYNLSWSDNADQLAFTMDRDTTKKHVRPYELYYWGKKRKGVTLIADQKSAFLPADHNISNYTKPTFSKDGTRLIFRITPPQLSQDTSLLDDEIVNVEVWHYNDSKLYTRQENSLEDDKKRDYACVYHIDDNSFSVLGKEEYDRMYFDEDYNSKYAIAQHTATYEKERMWNGYGHFDGYRIEIRTGDTKKFATKERGRISRSSSGKYCFWYDASIQGHRSYNVEENKINKITSKEIGIFGDEKNDRPMDPTSYGYHEFSKNDEFIIIYDRYDIWLIDPDNDNEPRRITNGRKDNKIYRVVDTDPDDKTTDLSVPLLVHVFDENDKSEAYASLDVISGKVIELYKGNVRLDKTPTKAKNSNDFITTLENYKTFPNLILTDNTFSEMKTFTDVNPQQKDYLWGDIKLHS